jgi:hypothetical protein
MKGDKLRNSQDPVEADVSPVMPDAAVRAAGNTGGLGQRQKAWLGMAAVLIALVLLTLMPTGSIGPNTPPTAADSAAVPRSGVDSGRFAVGMDAPLHFVLKDVNGIDVNLPQQADEQQAGRPAFSVPLQRAQHDPKPAKNHSFFGKAIEPGGSGLREAITPHESPSVLSSAEDALGGDEQQRFEPVRGFVTGS